MATDGGPAYEALVLGHPKTGAEAEHGQLGACPFSHRVLLLLEELELPYRTEFVDVAHKPAWVGEVNPQGTLPIVRELASERHVCDSDAISDFLEEQHGGAKRSLKKLEDCPQPAPQLWPKFLAFLSAQPGSQEEAEAKRELQGQLQMANEALPNERPYVGDKDVCAYDCALAPRLYLARQGCKLLKGWDWGDEFENVKAYLHRMTGRASWRNSASWDDEVIAADLRRKMPAA